MKTFVYLKKGYWWFVLYEKPEGVAPEDMPSQTVSYVCPSSTLTGRWKFVKKELRGIPLYRRSYATQKEAELCAAQALQHELCKQVK